jgi:hypothetical protein
VPPVGAIRRAALFSILKSLRKELSMYYVICPVCEARVEIPGAAYGPDRTDLYNVTECDNCCTCFDYDDEDVEEDKGDEERW